MAWTDGPTSGTLGLYDGGLYVDIQDREDEAGVRRPGATEPVPPASRQPIADTCPTGCVSVPSGSAGPEQPRAITASLRAYLFGVLTCGCHSRLTDRRSRPTGLRSRVPGLWPGPLPALVRPLVNGIPPERPADELRQPGTALGTELRLQFHRHAQTASGVPRYSGTRTGLVPANSKAIDITRSHSECGTNRRIGS